MRLESGVNSFFHAYFTPILLSLFPPFYKFAILKDRAFGQRLVNA